MTDSRVSKRQKIKDTRGLGGLSFDALALISAYNGGSSNLADTSQRTRRALEGRRMVYITTEDNIKRTIGGITDPTRILCVGSIHLIVPRFPPGLREKLTELYQVARVHALEITFLSDDVDRSLDIAETIGALKDRTPSLNVLRLDFADLSPSVSQALFPYLLSVYNWTTLDFCEIGGLGMAPGLHTLWLDLSGNKVGDDNVNCLARLNLSPVLQTLHLSLKKTQIGPSGARALSRLGEAPALRTLYIDLEGNHIGSTGAVWLSRLGGSPVLRSLYLGCKGTNIDDAGAISLSTLQRSSALCDLHLNLDHNRIGSAGGVALGTLYHAPGLCTVTIDIENNDSGGRAPRPSWVSMAHIPRMVFPIVLGVGLHLGERIQAYTQNTHHV
jgi:hypothetical protein